jgi:hypothetical protein
MFSRQKGEIGDTLRGKTSATLSCNFAVRNSDLGLNCPQVKLHFHKVATYLANFYNTMASVGLVC